MAAGGRELDRLGVRLLAGAGLAALLAGSGLAVATALDRGTASDTSPSTTPVASKPKPKPARPIVRVRLQAVGALDPEGDKRENDAAAGLAVDGDAATAWSTERYDTFFKQGVGLVLDAGAVRRLERLDVVSGTPGVVAEIRTGPSPDGPFRTVAAGTPLADTTTYRLRGARGRYVVVWITAIPGGGAAEIAEVRLRARR